MLSGGEAIAEAKQVWIGSVSFSGSKVGYKCKVLFKQDMIAIATSYLPVAARNQWYTAVSSSFR